MTDLDAPTDAQEAVRTYNPYVAEFLEHEFETYDIIRSGCPVGYSEAANSQGMDGMWVVTDEQIEWVS